MQKFLLTLCSVLLLTGFTCAEKKQFDQHVKQSKINSFRNFPKGADLHTHLDGAVYAESLLAAVKENQFCLNKKDYVATPEKQCDGALDLAKLKQRPSLYKKLLEKWSMKNFKAKTENGHDHFFKTFEKFVSVSSANRVATMTDVLSRAAQNNVVYLEVMDTMDNDASGLIGKQIPFSNDFSKMQAALDKSALPELVKRTAKQAKELRINLDRSLHCYNPIRREKACDVKYKFLYQVLREQEPNAIFASIYLGFQLAKTSPNFVGLNLVQPEDGKISTRDYSLHMQMIRYFHEKFPKVKISLHAGELIPGLVDDEALKFHITEAVNVAKASRIGHGVAIKHETNYKQLLQTMRDQGIMVEINLSSNDAILGVKGLAHPIHLYLQNNVPVAVSTDDEGILRTNISTEYEKAYEDSNLDYCTLKQMSRNSLTYSFLPGESIWDKKNPNKLTPVCQVNNILKSPPSKKCMQLLTHSEKARTQWQLEKKFALYEKRWL